MKDLEGEVAMGTNEAQLNELAYNVSILVSHACFLMFFEEYAEDGFPVFLKSNFRDVQHRCAKIHKLLEELAITNAEFHRKIISSDGGKFRDYYVLPLSWLITIADEPSNHETLNFMRERMRERMFIAFLVRIASVLPSTTFDMFDDETQNGIQGDLDKLKRILTTKESES